MMHHRYSLKPTERWGCSTCLPRRCRLRPNTVLDTRCILESFCIDRRCSSTSLQRWSIEDPRRYSMNLSTCSRNQTCLVSDFCRDKRRLRSPHTMPWSSARRVWSTLSNWSSRNHPTVCRRCNTGIHFRSTKPFSSCQNCRRIHTSVAPSR